MAQGALKYRDKVSQLISWGHWFCLGNIVITLLIAIRYLYIAHWPDTYLGQAYMLISWLGQFSFLPFMIFLLTLFPLSFLLPSNRSMRFLGAIIATIGMSALAIDTQVFSRFYVHLNPMLWQLLIDKENNRQSTDVNLVFILVPLIFFMELLMARLCWVSLRRLERRRIGKPIAIGFFICFFLTHIIHVWADATIYRPITSQKINYPLFYPMTARNFLNSYGLIDIERIRQKSRQAGLHDGNPLTYPERPLEYTNQTTPPMNLLMIVVEGLRFDALNAKSMPKTWQLAQHSLQFTHHYSGSNDHTLGLYSLFYGLPTSYWKSVEEASISPVMFTALKHRDYKIALFNSDGFHNAALDNTVWGDIPAKQLSQAKMDGGVKGDGQVVSLWQQWQAAHAQTQPWFNYLDFTGVVHLDVPPHTLPNSVNSSRQWQTMYQHAVANADQKIGQVLTTLQDSGQLKNTVVIITSDHGQEFSDQQSGRWGYGNNLSKYQTQVPLVIHWPGIAPKVINTDTSHLDISTTINSELLGVNNQPSDYSIGTDLLTLSSQSRGWILVGNADEQAIYQKHKITLFNNHGDYQVRNRDYQKVNARADMPIILQVLNELRRFYRDDS
ncbi:DUF3413 domain-containing protein [Celerinatantimonas yamalensis]|uniref:DUF3413 domain-containing protein n=1 Tax=Celerinatantimonas yamalensis TaxID=559956 RepID=A0ABW9G4A4_9GAMM